MKGVFLCLLSWLLNTVLNAIAKDIHNSTTVPTIFLFQNIVGLILTLPYAMKHHFRNGNYKKSPFFLISVRCVSGQLTMLFLLFAVMKISLSNAILLSNTAPFFVPLVAWIWLKSRVDPRAWYGILIGFIGVMFILRPTTGIFNIGSVYAVISGIFLAILMLSMRLLAFKENVLIISFYNFVFGSLVSIPLSIFYWEVGSLATLVKLIVIGLFVLATQLLMLKAFHYGKPSQLGPLVYSQVVYAAIIDWLVWKQIPAPLTVLGMSLVCLSGIAIVLLVNKKGLKKYEH